MDKKMKLIVVLLLLAMFFSIRQTIKLRNTRQLTKALLEESMQMFIAAGDTDDNDQLYWSAYGNMIAASKLYTVLCPV